MKVCPNCGYEEDRDLTDVEKAVLAEREAILKYLINERVLFEEGAIANGIRGLEHHG